MKEEILQGINSLPDGVDEIIEQVEGNRNVADAYLSNKKFFNDFNSLLSDLNKLLSEEKEIPQKLNQISLF
jgi:hypothetical protein